MFQYLANLQLLKTILKRLEVKTQGSFSIWDTPEEMSKYLSPYPPTTQQIATAKQAAIEEVEKRFEAIGKEATNEV